jgi:uroporphyrinogen decarboxylase
MKMDKMSPKERLVTALENKMPDRLPVTTHHVLPYFLQKYMNGINSDEFFEYFALDPIAWTVPTKPDEKIGNYYNPEQRELGFLESREIVSDEWILKREELSDPDYKTQRCSIITPGGTLTTILQSNEHTVWVSERLIKEKKDMDIIAKYMTYPLIDVEEVNKTAEKYGNKALVRGWTQFFDFYGQPGCWQDAACLLGIERLILETYDDPIWVKELLDILKKRKIPFMRSLKGAKYDVLEFGGGDASSSVISPRIFEEFVAPYDSELIEEAHKAGQRITYHTCGGMMPILEIIADMKPDAMETLTPPGMGADVDLKEAKKRIGDRVCMIGGFDQFHFFKDCTPEQTREEVRRCFNAAGENGGYILSPSDHFFDADLELIKAFADEGRKCTY